MIKKLIVIYIIITIWLFGIIYFSQNHQKKNFDAWIWTQYTSLNILYQTWNFTEFFDKQTLHKEFWDFSSDIIKVPVVCDEIWCFSPYALELKAISWNFTIYWYMVYRTKAKDSDFVGPYYFFHNTPIYIEEWEDILLDKSFTYENLSWLDVKPYLPKEYWSFIFQNPIELYYNIKATRMNVNGAEAIISLKDK